MFGKKFKQNEMKLLGVIILLALGGIGAYFAGITPVFSGLAIGIAIGAMIGWEFIRKEEPAKEELSE